LSSCNIEKRVHRPGFYISGRHSSKEDLDDKKRVKHIVFEETHTLETKSDAVVVATEEYTSSRRPSDSSDSTIEENNTANIHQSNKILSKTYADSIPEEGKLLLAKYEKTHKAKDKIAKIAFYPIALLALCWFTASLLFVPIVFGLISYDGDPNIKRFFIVCLSAIAFTIPLLIAHFILSIITKKQRRKLIRMGLVK